MTVGLEVKNDDGDFQIADGYYNLLFREKIQVVINPNEADRLKIVPHNGSIEAFVVIHSPVVYACLQPYQAELPMGKVGLALLNPTNQTQIITLVIYDTPGNIPDLGVGMQVFDELGRQTYTSAAPLKLHLTTLPQAASVGFYTYSYYHYFSTSSFTYVKVNAVRLTNAHNVERRMIESVAEVTVSGGSWTSEGGNDVTHFIDLSDIL